MVRSDISNIPTETLPPANTTIKGALQNNDVKSSFMTLLLTANYRGDQRRKCAAYVTHDGHVDVYGSSVNSSNIGVRPALWLSLMPGL